MDDDDYKCVCWRCGMWGVLNVEECDCGDDVRSQRGGDGSEAGCCGGGKVGKCRHVGTEGGGVLLVVCGCDGR